MAETCLRRGKDLAPHPNPSAGCTTILGGLQHSLTFLHLSFTELHFPGV